MSFGQQVITDISFWLVILLLALLLNYLAFKTLRSRTITLLITTACIAIGVSTIIEKLDFNNFIDQQQLSVLEKIFNIRSRLEGEIQTDLEISKALVIYIKSKKFIFTKEEFNKISQSILDNDARIRHIAVAENLIVNYVYPYEQNKQAIGLDYKKNTQQWPTIERAIINNKTLLAGPVNLVQGGVAFIGRLAMVHGIVHTTNGHLLLESKTAVGTKIKLIFPILEALGISTFLSKPVNLNELSDLIYSFHS